MPEVPEELNPSFSESEKQEARQAGVDAFFRGIDFYANPYRSPSEAALAKKWSLGWNDAAEARDSLN